MTARFDIDLVDWFRQNADQVERDLTTYYGGGTAPYTGRWFDRYAGSTDPSIFTALDLVAVEALSVQVPPEAAAVLLLEGGERFNALLRDLPSGTLWETEESTIGPGSSAYRLHEALCDMPGIGWVTAGKLMAAKRPELIPVYDSKVEALINQSRIPVWLTLRSILSEDAARDAIEGACQAAPGHVTLLRRIDVALWMAATR